MKSLLDLRCSFTRLMPAKTLLSEAKTLFLQSSFLASEEIANQAIELVEEILENMMLAEAKITAAKTAIQVAQDSGKTIGLDEAESFLTDAETKFEEGDYEQALIHADEAFEAALNSEKPENNTFYYRKY